MEVVQAHPNAALPGKIIPEEEKKAYNVIMEKSGQLVRRNQRL